MAKNRLLKYDAETDYLPIRDKAALDGDFELAVEAETLNNRKYDELGTPEKKTYDFAKTPAELDSVKSGKQYVGIGSYTEDGALNTSGFLREYNEKKPVHESVYDDAINQLLDDINNREEFSYNAETDPMYQQYAKMYKREGDRAMEDTLAQAAINAGGMNSYAIGAAQQAANYYNAQLADKIPELEQIAYEMYLRDNEDDLNRLNLYRSLEDDAYGKHLDELKDFYTDRSAAVNAYVDDYNSKLERDATKLANERYDEETRLANDRYNEETRLANERYDEETRLANERYDRETAKDDIWNLIGLGVNPTDAELIERSGMNADDIARAASEQQRQSYEKYKSEDEGYYGDGWTRDWVRDNSPRTTDNPASAFVGLSKTLVDKYLNGGNAQTAEISEQDYTEIDDFLSGMMQTEGFDSVKTALDDAFDTGILDKTTYNKLLEKYQYMQ
jgi:hypothetical protein